MADWAQEIMARTAWGEARGEGYIGMLAVCWVIRNRALNPRWWGRNVADVCLLPRQFSCWNENDPNRRPLLWVDERDRQFTEALRAAGAALAGEGDDPTITSDHFHATHMRPTWAADRNPVITIGRHRFHRLELTQSPRRVTL